jgi:hypothetical protein
VSSRRSALPLAALAVSKALAQLQIARSAACVSDEDLAAEIADAQALLERLRARIVGVGTGASTACRRSQGARWPGAGGGFKTK